uniref:Uncharacterized protein n=1 Tax=Arundo donax TaxID=35708 RepID=A0A0A8YVG2_ARUDO
MFRVRPPVSLLTSQYPSVTTLTC